MEVEPEKMIAIVCASGSGKSAIADLLERWYELDGEMRNFLPERANKDDKAEKGKKKAKDNKSETTDDDAEAATTAFTLMTVSNRPHPARAVHFQRYNPQQKTSSKDARRERLVKAALNKVSEGRTTNAIAHQLSTIKRADKIILLKRGQLLEQGTYDYLLADMNGAYRAFVNAQKLSMGEGFAEESHLIEISKNIMVGIVSAASGEAKSTEAEEQAWKAEDRASSVPLGYCYIRAEILLALVFSPFLACAGAGSSNPIQVLLFAKILNVTTWTCGGLRSARDHSALMFFVLPLGCALAILRKTTDFFDTEEKSSGRLTARVANDSTQVQQMLGINVAQVYSALLSLIGRITIAFVYGWKLILVTFFVPMPVTLAMFADSSRFAAEAIGAFRTVTASTTEGMITPFYSTVHGSDLVVRRAIASESHSEGADTLLSLGPNMAQAPAAANRTLSFRTRKKPIRNQRWRSRIRMKLQDLWFRHLSRDILILTGLNITTEKGQFAARVGSSGSRKIEIVSLLECPDEKEILENGTDFAGRDTRQYCKMISPGARTYDFFRGLPFSSHYQGRHIV
ncbi:ABC transporter transmembrane region [Diplocarpon rosae]|nr:ABC transporter transmembrane region [Diplocarpon rosae]